MPSGWDDPDEDIWPRAGRFGYEGSWHREAVASSETISEGGPEWEVTLTSGMHIRVVANRMTIDHGALLFWDREDEPCPDLAYGPGTWHRVRRERSYRVP